MALFKKRSSIRISYIKKEERPLFIISAIRVNQGGTLEVVNDFLRHADRHFAGQFRFIAFIYRKELYPDISNIELREFPKSRKSFLYRMWMEYCGFFMMSRKLRPEIWFSIQDSTPFVAAKSQYLYWGSALLQRGVRWSDFFSDRKLFFISVLYRFVYCKNIQSNSGVFVQQQNLKKFLHESLSIPQDKIHVSPLSLNHSLRISEKPPKDPFVFLYPCYPYAYKNLELIIAAAEDMEWSGHVAEIWLTSKGDENSYVKTLYKSAAHLKSIKWMGYHPYDQINHLYDHADGLIYVSQCESWGIPLSLFKKMQKPILAADLPYAKETLGVYNKVSFVNVKTPRQLSEKMQSLVRGESCYDQTDVGPTPQVLLPDWTHIIELMKHENNACHIRRLQLRPAIAETV